MTDVATETWLNAQKDSTRATYKAFWRFFIEYTKMTGDEILAAKKGGFYWESVVLEFKKYIEAKKSGYTARTAITAVRSFFTFHRRTLDFRRGEKARLSEAARLRDDYRFSLDDLAKMAAVSDLEEKYVLLLGKSFGLRAGDFLRLTRGDLEPYIDREPPISIGEYDTEKEGVKAFPLVDADAQPIIKLVLEKMAREGRTKPEDKMLKYRDKIQLTRILKRIVRKAGINTGGKAVRFHCMRKFLIDHLASYMSESKWKQIVGKKISEGAYVSPDSLREDYKRATVETCFSKAATSEDIQLVAKKEALKILAKMQGFTETDMAKIFRTRKTVTTEDEVKAIEEELEKRQKKEDCDDNEHCQKIVSETELSDFLSQGWRVVSALPSGKIVIEH